MADAPHSKCGGATREGPNPSPGTDFLNVEGQVSVKPDQIRDLRRSLGLSQTQFAIRLNALDPDVRASMTAVSKWENGWRNPSPNTAAALNKLAGKGITLAEALSAEALAAEKKAEIAIRNNQPEVAEEAIRRARQLRRMAFSHR